MKDFRSRGRRGQRDRSLDVAETTASAPAATPSALSAGPVGGGFQLPIIGPVTMPTVAAPTGYAYRNNVMFPSNLDRIELIQRYVTFNLKGYHTSGGGVLPAASSLKYIEDNFWPNAYVMLHEMAQLRDGYKSQDSTLTTPLNLRYRDEMIIALKVNIRVLWALYHCTMYNEAMNQSLGAFGGKYSRMKRILENSNKIVYAAVLDGIIDYWSTVFVPYPGGPICYNLFDLQVPGTSLAPAVGAFTVWSNGNQPYPNVSADVSSLLDDIELGISIVNMYNANVATVKTDLKLITSMYKMMSFPMPQTGVKGLTVSPKHWVDQFKSGAFYFLDNKGAGADVFHGYPDIRGDMEQLIQVPDLGVPMDDLDWHGMKMLYAFDFGDDDTPPYTGSASKILGFGCAALTEMSGGPFYHAARIYTQEDGFYEQGISVDMTAAAGLQSYLWQYPTVTLHPQSWVLVASEEAEEYYRHHLEEGPASFQMPVDHHGERFMYWLYRAYGIPFVK